VAVEEVVQISTLSSETCKAKEGLPFHYFTILLFYYFTILLFYYFTSLLLSVVGYSRKLLKSARVKKKRLIYSLLILF